MNDFTNEIKKHILNLPINHLVLFCALNCEKMLPGYLLFSRKEEWGDTTFFQSAIEEIYKQLIQKDDRLDYGITREKLGINSPDLEEFSSIMASYAFDVCCAFDELLQFFITSDKTHVFNNSQYCINSVDMFIQQKNGINYVEFDKIQDLENMISQDSFMLKEKNRQLQLLTGIKKIDILDIKRIELLRQLNAGLNPLVDYDIFG